MAQDNSNYEIVQLSETEWGIQYESGPLVGGFGSRQVAIENAGVRAENSPPPTPRTGDPQNLAEAMTLAQERRDAYSSFISDNPNASDEEKEALVGEIIAADVFVSDYQYQHELSRKEASLVDPQWLLDIEQQIENADTQRNIKARAAVQARLDPESTPEEIIKADNEAFDAEFYFRSLVREREDEVLRVSGLDESPNNMYPGGSRSIMNFGGQIISSESSGTDSRDGSTNLIQNTLNPEFGSITRGNEVSNSIVSGYGSTRYSGNTVYDTSVGVTSASSGVDQRVKLSPKPSQQAAMMSGILAPLREAGGLVFPFTPTITYRAAVNYNVLSTVHTNHDWDLYQNTPSVDLSIQGMFTAQNKTEAEYLLAAIHFLRVCTKMHFGADDPNKGLPPPQVFLNGYGTHMFNGLSVIVKSYDVELSNNVDYVSVRTNNGESKVPTVSRITVDVTVQQTPKKTREFNWNKFADGSLMQAKGGWI